MNIKFLKCFWERHGGILAVWLIYEDHGNLVSYGQGVAHPSTMNSRGYKVKQSIWGCSKEDFLAYPTARVLANPPVDLSKFNTGWWGSKAVRQGKRGTQKVLRPIEIRGLSWRYLKSEIYNWLSLNGLWKIVVEPWTCQANLLHLGLKLLMEDLLVFWFSEKTFDFSLF